MTPISRFVPVPRTPLPDTDHKFNYKSAVQHQALVKLLIPTETDTAHHIIDLLLLDKTLSSTEI